MAQNYYLYYILISILVLTACWNSTEQKKKNNMAKDYKTLNDVMKETQNESTVLVKTNNPSISIRKGFDFVDTYRAAVVKNFDEIESGLLTERENPRKQTLMEFITIKNKLLKSARAFKLLSGLPVDVNELKKLNIDCVKLLNEGRLRFFINDGMLALFSLEKLMELKEYFVIKVLNEEEKLFDVYLVKLKPNTKSHMVYNYEGESENVSTSEFEFLYNDRNDFTGIKNLDFVEVQ